STRGDLIASKTGTAAESFLPFASATSFVPAATTVPFAVNPLMNGSINPYATGLSNPYVASLYLSPYAAPYSVPNNGTPASQYNVAAANVNGRNAETRTSSDTILEGYGIPSENGHIK